MNEDAELLRRYVEEHSETAFTELIRQHVDLVYSTALRLMNGDVHRAQDVSQQVFTELARQSKRLMAHPALLGWLYTTTRQMALRIIRTEARRAAREREASTMNELLREPGAEPDWEQLRPVLEDAMHELNEIDRLAILHRFFKNKSLRQVGDALGLSDNAARMRIDRALDKLRSQLAQRGVTSAAAALATTLTSHAVTAAPAGLVATLATTSLAGAAKAGSSLTLLKIMATTKLKLAAAALLIAGAATIIIVQHQSQSRLQNENEALRRELAEVRSDLDGASNRLARLARQSAHLPPPPAQFATTTHSALDDVPWTNFLAGLVKKPLRLTAEQAEAFVTENNRSATSLLGAYRTTGSPTYLQEAMQRFPDDPQVAFEAAFRKDASPEEKRGWLEALKKATPNNPLGNYLSAIDYFNAGQADLAVADLAAASGKTHFNDYYLDLRQTDEEAYRAAGYSEAEARAAAGFGAPPPDLPALRQLAIKMRDLADSYRQSGDDSSAQATLQIMLNLGAQLDGRSSVVSIPLMRAHGLAIDRLALQAGASGPETQAVNDQIDSINVEVGAIKNESTALDAMAGRVTPQDMINFLDRARLFGDEAAFAWLKQKYPDKQP